MKIPRTLRKYIEAGKLDEVEGTWLAQLEEDPTDSEFFLSGARALKGAGEDDAAKTLLELLDGEWEERGLHELRLEMLRDVGALLHAAQPLHDAILEVLAAVYEGYPSFEGLVEHVGLHRATEDIPKTWTKVDYLRDLLEFEEGAIVAMKGKGAGRVTEVNFALGNFKVDFERSPGLRVGFKGATKLLSSLPKEHVLRRKIEAPEELSELKAADPGKLLLVTLRSYSEGRNATQVREALAGIVSEKEWSSWWTAARKNPQVLVEGKGARQTYKAAASSEDAESAVHEAFAAAKLPEKLDIFRRNATRNAELRDTLAEQLVAIAESSLSIEVETRFAIAQAVREAPSFDEAAPWAPQSMVAEAADGAALLSKIEDRGLREMALELIRESREDWEEIFVARLTAEEDPKLLDRIADGLGGDARVTEFIDRVLTQPRKQAAAFHWLAERALRDESLLERKPIRFLQTLLATSQPAEFEPFKSRLRKVLEGGGPAAGLIAHIEADQASGAEELIRRSPLEEYVRAPLINALHLRFPELRPEEESPLYALPDSIAERKEQLRELREVEIPANRRAIEEARELGDLKENFEYKSARQRHEYLAARQGSLQLDLARAQPIDLGRSDAEEVRVAVTVELVDSQGATEALTILGPWESHPEEGVISYDSDLGRALLGKKVGEPVEFGESSRTVQSIVPWKP